jgi:hypothetical protein
MIQWGPSASSDLLYYKLYREYNNEVKDITATLKTTRYYYDTHLDFPVNSGSNYVYYYHVTAYDSSGNESLPSVKVLSGQLIWSLAILAGMYFKMWGNHLLSLY